MSDGAPMAPGRRLPRRRFLELSASAGLAATAGGLLAACAPAQQPTAASSAPAPKSPSAAAPQSSGETGSPRSLLKVRYADARGLMGDWGVWVGREKRFFEEEGVDLEHNVLGSVTDTANAVIAGQSDVGVGAVPAVVAAVRRGTPLRLAMASQLATPAGRFNNWWCALPGSPVTQPSDLRGKKVGTLAPGTLSQLVVRTVLRKHGVNPGEYEEVGFPFDQAYTALKGGQVDTTIFIEPFYTNFNKVARDEYNGRELQVVFTILDPFPTGMHLSCLFCNTNWAAQNREAANRFARAQLRAARWGQENADDTKQTIAKYAGVPYENIKDMIAAELSTDGKMLPGFLRQMQEYMIVEGTVEGLTEPLPDSQILEAAFVPSA